MARMTEFESYKVTKKKKKKTQTAHIRMLFFPQLRSDSGVKPRTGLAHWQPARQAVVVAAAATFSRCLTRLISFFSSHLGHRTVNRSRLCFCTPPPPPQSVRSEDHRWRPTYGINQLPQGVCACACVCVCVWGGGFYNPMQI